jgi:hypothetical protein
MKIGFYAFIICIICLQFIPASAKIHSDTAAVYLDSNATIEARVEDLLGRMTLDEKVGQMVQENYSGLNNQSDIQSYGLGSVLATADIGPAGKTPAAWADLYDTLQSYAMKTRLGIPLLFGIDAVHGIGSVYGSTIFPHNIGMGCTRNPLLVTQAAQITALEMSATGTTHMAHVTLDGNDTSGEYECDVLAGKHSSLVDSFIGDADNFMLSQSPESRLFVDRKIFLWIVQLHRDFLAQGNRFAGWLVLIDSKTVTLSWTEIQFSMVEKVIADLSEVDFG